MKEPSKISGLKSKVRAPLGLAGFGLWTLDFGL